MVTVTRTFTDGLNTSVQVRVTEVPTVMMPGGLLSILTVGHGTRHEKRIFCIMYMLD